MIDEERFQEFMDRWAPEYHRPPDTPREEIWDGIRAAVFEGGGEEEKKVVSLPERRRARNRTLRRSWWPAAAVAAAVLAVGFGLGRLTAPGPPGAGGGAEGVGLAEAVGGSNGFRTAALSHFSETESFLTLVRGDARAGRVGPELARWAEGLLGETRLLLDSPAARDPAVRTLLEDLELILVQAAGVGETEGGGTERVRQELELMAAGMDDHDVIPRLQAMVPETPVNVGP